MLKISPFRVHLPPACGDLASSSMHQQNGIDSNAIYHSSSSLNPFELDEFANTINFLHKFICNWICKFKRVLFQFFRRSFPNSSNLPRLLLSISWFHHSFVTWSDIRLQIFYWVNYEPVIVEDCDAEPSSLSFLGKVTCCVPNKEEPPPFVVRVRELHRKFRFTIHMSHSALR